MISFFHDLTFFLLSLFLFKSCSHFTKASPLFFTKLCSFDDTDSYPDTQVAYSAFLCLVICRLLYFLVYADFNSSFPSFWQNHSRCPHFQHWHTVLYGDYIYFSQVPKQVLFFAAHIVITNVACKNIAIVSFCNSNWRRNHRCKKPSLLMPQ